MKKVLGVGAALVDLLSKVDDTWIVAQGEPKGGMTLVDWERMEPMLQTLSALEKVPGGSACNTVRGLGTLGGETAFLSKVGDDDLGTLFRDSLAQAHVESLLISSSTPTGRVLSAVTSDAQRTMYTFLGASAEVQPSDLQPSVFQGAAMTYLEGYIAFNAPWFRAVVEASHQAGVPVGLDFGSFSVIECCRAEIEWALEKQAVGLLVANEDEAKAWTGCEGENALQPLIATGVETVVLKLGREGSLIAHQGQVTRVAAQTVQAVDTTGAGDLWATGFLYGWQQGWEMERCGQLASAVAAEVVQVMGPVIPAAGWQRVAQLLSL